MLPSGAPRQLLQFIETFTWLAESQAGGPRTSLQLSIVCLFVWLLLLLLLLSAAVAVGQAAMRASLCGSLRLGLTLSKHYLVFFLRQRGRMCNFIYTTHAATHTLKAFPHKLPHVNCELCGHKIKVTAGNHFSFECRDTNIICYAAGMSTSGSGKWTVWAIIRVAE